MLGHSLLQSVTLPNNPFSPNGDGVKDQALFNYTLNAPVDNVRVTVLSLRGNTVKVIDSGGQLAGDHSKDWDGMDRDGRLVANGIYFYSIEATSGGQKDTFKQVIEAAAVRRALLLAAAVLAGAPLRAAFEPLGEGAAAQGVGGAYTAAVEDASAAYWNPAALPLLKASQAGASTEDLGGLHLLRYSAISYAQPNLGGGAFGFNYLRLQTMGDASFLNYAENTYVVGYGRPWLGGFSYGGAFRYYAEASSVKATAIGLDAALLYRTPGRNFRAAVEVENVNRPNLRWATGAVDEIPPYVRSALYWRTSPFADLFAEEDWRKGDKQIQRAGIALYFMDRTFAIRGGVHKSQAQTSTGFSIGGGLRIHSLDVDYAWDQGEQSDNTQVFSLGWRFGP